MAAEWSLMVLLLFELIASPFVYGVLALVGIGAWLCAPPKKKGKR